LKFISFYLLSQYTVIWLYVLSYQEIFCWVTSRY